MKPLYPTTISTARSCWRRLAAKDIFRIKGQRARPFDGELGNELHDLAERWNKLGHAPQPDRSVADNLFIAGLPYCPQPRMGASEDERRVEINGIAYAMRRDWDGTLGELPKTEELAGTYGPETPAQLDYKSSTDPFKWGLWTREKWLDDPQAVLEGLELSIRSGSDVVMSRWLYFKKPKKDAEGNYKLRGKVEAFPSDIILGRDALNRAHLKIIEPFARGINELREAHAAGALTDFRALPYNKEACGDYGGCDYLAHCGNYFPPQQAVAVGYQPPNGAYSAPTAQISANALAVNGPLPGVQGEIDMSLFPSMAAGQAPAPAFAPAPSPFQQAAPPAFQPTSSMMHPSLVTQAAPSTAPILPPFQQAAPPPPVQFQQQAAPALPPTHQQGPAITGMPTLALPPAQTYAAPPPAPAMAPVGNPNYTLNPATGMYAPALPPAPTAPAPSHPGFVGYNAPEVRNPPAPAAPGLAPDYDPTTSHIAIQQVAPLAEQVQSLKAPGLSPREAIDALRPTDDQAFEALKILRRWF